MGTAWARRKLGVADLDGVVFEKGAMVNWGESALVPTPSSVPKALEVKP